jgi:hypothetical protein
VGQSEHYDFPNVENRLFVVNFLLGVEFQFGPHCGFCDCLQCELSDVGVDTNKGSVALRFENFDEFVSFFVEDTDELLKSVEVETWGQDSSPGHPFSSIAG